MEPPRKLGSSFQVGFQGILKPRGFWERPKWQSRPQGLPGLPGYGGSSGGLWRLPAGSRLLGVHFQPNLNVLSVGIGGAFPSVCAELCRAVCGLSMPAAGKQPGRKGVRFSGIRPPMKPPTHLLNYPLHTTLCMCGVNATAPWGASPTPRPTLGGLRPTDTL